MYSTDDDCVASHHNTTDQTAALTHTSNCGRHGCATVFVYSGATDWPTVNRAVNEHYLVCKGGIRGLEFSYPPSNTYSTPKMPSPPQLAPESLGSDDSHHNNFVIAGHSKRTGRKSKRNRNEGERKEYLENDEYTDDVRPKSVKCRGCGGVICLDNRYRYYPGLWDRHRDLCRGILRLEPWEKTVLLRRIQNKLPALLG
ncbi:hypothetical protein CY34DRAFT_799378 [Suillus luteus UH-Slu-Lm8-n1]|uniref:Uncharacterized protein n=1 Tax=Suillus luteus UH-Slu-Lm8-n1 TaxID=930992 RepID=A0A0D0B0C0_9AGAM|nr:hypothetical protein CY34DRAFT_799378 [Suillus luteus UH-Slu-Lm8-n1]